MPQTLSSVGKRWPLPLVGVIVVVLAGIMAFFWLDNTEPQDVLIHGLGLDHIGEEYTFDVDGNQVGTGPFVCVSQMQQGKRKIEIRSATETVTFTASIGDVGANIIEPRHLRGYEYVELSNCEDQELIRKQTTFPYISPMTGSPMNGSATHTVR